MSWDCYFGLDRSAEKYPDDAVQSWIAQVRSEAFGDKPFYRIVFDTDDLFMFIAGGQEEGRWLVTYIRKE